MIFVPAPTPVSDHNVRLIFSNRVANCEAALLVERNLGVRIRKKLGLRSKQMSCFLSGCSLHLSVLLNWDIFRSSPLSQRETHQCSGSSALDLLRQGRSHGEESVTRMRRDRHDLARSAVG